MNTLLNNPETIIKIVATGISIMALLIGIFISMIGNDTTKNLKEENERMSKFGSTLYNSGLVFLVLTIGSLVGTVAYRPEFKNILMKFIYPICAAIAILIMFIIVGSFINSYDKDSTLDDETRNDKYAVLGQWVSTVGLASILLIYFIKF